MTKPIDDLTAALAFGVPPKACADAETCPAYGGLGCAAAQELVARGVEKAIETLFLEQSTEADSLGHAATLRQLADDIRKGKA